MQGGVPHITAAARCGASLHALHSPKHFMSSCSAFSRRHATLLFRRVVPTPPPSPPIVVATSVGTPSAAPPLPPSACSDTTPSVSSLSCSSSEPDVVVVDSKIDATFVHAEDATKEHVSAASTTATTSFTATQQSTLSSSSSLSPPSPSSSYFSWRGLWSTTTKDDIGDSPPLSTTTTTNNNNNTAPLAAAHTNSTASVQALQWKRLVDQAVVMYFSAWEWIDLPMTSPAAMQSSPAPAHPHEATESQRRPEVVKPQSQRSAASTSRSADKAKKEQRVAAAAAEKEGQAAAAAVVVCEICGGRCDPFPSVGEASFDAWLEQLRVRPVASSCEAGGGGGAPEEAVVDPVEVPDDPQLQALAAAVVKLPSTTTTAAATTKKSSSSKFFLRDVDRELLSSARTLLGSNKDRHVGTIDVVARGLSRAVLRHSRTDDVAERQRRIAFRYPKVPPTRSDSSSSPTATGAFGMTPEAYKVALHAGRISAATYAATNLLPPDSAATLSHAELEALFQKAATFALNRGYCTCHEHLPHHHAVPHDHALEVLHVSLGQRAKEPSFMVVMDFVLRTCFVTFRGTITTEDIITDVLPAPTVVPRGDDVMRSIEKKKGEHCSGLSEAEKREAPTDDEACTSSSACGDVERSNAHHPMYIGPEGMVDAAIASAKVLIPLLSELHAQYSPLGYQFVLTGHSLGSAMANILKVIIETSSVELRSTLPTPLQVIGFATPPSLRCVSKTTNLVSPPPVASKSTLSRDETATTAASPASPPPQGQTGKCVSLHDDPYVINFVYGNDIVSRLQVALFQRLMEHQDDPLHSDQSPPPPTTTPTKRQEDVVEAAGGERPLSSAAKEAERPFSGLSDEGHTTAAASSPPPSPKGVVDVAEPHLDQEETESNLDVFSLRKPYTLPGNIIYVSPPELASFTEAEYSKSDKNDPSSFSSAKSSKAERSFVVPAPRLITDLYRSHHARNFEKYSTAAPHKVSKDWLQWHTPVFHRCAVQHHFLFPLLKSLWLSTVGKGEAEEGRRTTDASASSDNDRINGNHQQQRR